jgi:glycosyltransferase involved in cell wall biosynthesis
MTEAQTPVLLSVFPSFSVGGAQVRYAALANHLGASWRHLIISLNGAHECAERLAPTLQVDLANPPLAGGVRRFIAEARPDVLLTHNWGTIEWALSGGLARALGGQLRHIHLEDGFGPDEADRQLLRRVWARRLVLRRSAVVLPSRTLHALAREVWRLPAQRLAYLPNGIDLERFRPRDQAPRRSGPPRVGVVGALRPEKNLLRLLRAARLLRDQGADFELAIVGDGPERGRLAATAADLGLEAAVRFLGNVADPAACYRDFDICALSSDTEQMPLSVLEAMGSGLPLAATAVGDVPQMVARENDPFLCMRNEAALADALGRLLPDPGLQSRVGAANRAKAEHEFDQALMFERYEQLLTGPPASARRG